MAVSARKEILARYRPYLTIDGVDVTDCFEYEMLPGLLPPGDPACESAGLS